MKTKVVKIILVLVGMIMLVSLSGCGFIRKKEANKQPQITEQEEIKEAIEIDRAEDFDGDIAVVTHTSNFVGTHYVIDRNFKILSTYEGNSTYIDGYMQIRDEENKKTNIVDTRGNVVFTYGDYEYEDVELVENGCIITTEQSDTYNSSNTVTGIYSLTENKYLVEPSEEYVNKIRTYGDNMLLLNDENTEFFNLETKSVVTYPERVTKEFKDGYSVEEDNDNYEIWYLKVFDDKGNVKRIQSPYTEEEIVYGREHANGMAFEVTSYIYRNEEGNERARTLGAIFNLQTGQTKDLSNEFWMVTNKPQYTEDGYALVTFSNQGGTPYYTVIDRNGNKLFEPQKVNDNAAFQPDDNGEPRKIVTENLQEGNYFIVTDNDITTVIDKDNNVVLAAGEDETFEGVTNNAVKVHWEKQGYRDQYYYKDLQGNKIAITN